MIALYSVYSTFFSLYASENISTANNYGYLYTGFSGLLNFVGIQHYHIGIYTELFIAH